MNIEKYVIHKPAALSKDIESPPIQNQRVKQINDDDSAVIVNIVIQSAVLYTGTGVFHAVVECSAIPKDAHLISIENEGSEG